MTTLFLSHASEDKDDFVRPLAEALRNEFKVWYDEYELVMGDSLRQRIDDGLKKCDFGVVVLSPYFFAKRWPKSELDGLFALESDERKIILPVWHNVGADEVKEFSPMLAIRLGVDSAQGIDKVVDSIKRAVEVSLRTKQIATDQWKEKFAALAFDIPHRKAVAEKNRTEAGVQEVMKAADELIVEGRKRAEMIAAEFSSAGIRPTGDPRPYLLNVCGPGLIQMRLSLSVRYMNVVEEIRLHLTYSCPDQNTLGRSLEDFENLAFAPVWGKDWKVLWQDPEHAFASGDALLDFAFKRYAEWIEKMA